MQANLLIEVASYILKNWLLVSAQVKLVIDHAHKDTKTIHPSEPKADKKSEQNILVGSTIGLIFVLGTLNPASKRYRLWSRTHHIRVFETWLKPLVDCEFFLCQRVSDIYPQVY